MAKAVKKKAAKKEVKKRASTYDKPIEFTGTFEDMIAISITGAGYKKNPSKKK
jgi:hypothetical protein